MFRGRERPVGGFTLIEALCSMGLFSFLALVLFYSLKNATQVWQRSSSRDNALRQLTRARFTLTRDLANASQQAQQYDTDILPPPSPSVGDALTFLTADNGVGGWSPDANGNAVMQSEITYYVYQPATNLMGVVCAPGPSDAGYEQQCSFKQLVRQVNPLVPTTPPAVPAIDTHWKSWIGVAPQSSATVELVANELLSLRVLRAPQEWQIELMAVANADATRQIALGSTPLSNSRYTLVQQFTVPAHN